MSNYYPEEVELCLKKATGFEWERIDPLYLRYKMQNNPFGQFCVVTPDNFPRTPARFNDFFIPTDREHLHNPTRFVERYLNAKHQLVEQMPWIKVDIDKLPSIESWKTGPRGTFKGVFTFSGDLKFRKVGSINNQTLGMGDFHNIGFSAKINVLSFLDSLIEANKLNVDILSQKLSIGKSIISPNGMIISVKARASNKLPFHLQITSEMTMPQNIGSIQFKGWDVQGQLAYKVEGDFYPDNNGVPPLVQSPSFIFKAEQTAAFGALNAMMIIDPEFGAEMKISPVIARHPHLFPTLVIFTVGEWLAEHYGPELLAGMW